MATVTGLTAARMLAIEAASVVDGTIDGSGHLILTKHDGSTIDAGDALIAVPAASDTINGVIEIATNTEVAAGIDTVRAVTPAGLASLVATSLAKGIVELATNAETATGTDATRAVTPAGFASVVGPIDTRVSTLEAEPGERVQLITTPTSTADNTAYPSGISVASLTATTAWVINGATALGTLITYNYSQYRCYQVYSTITSNSGDVPDMWTRTYYSGIGWSAWVEIRTSVVETTSAGAIASTNFTITQFYARRTAGVCSFQVLLTYSGSDIVPSSTDGNIPDTAMVTLPSGWRPIFDVEVIVSDGFGSGTAKLDNTTGLITLRTWTSIGKITSGRTLIINATYVQ